MSAELPSWREVLLRGHRTFPDVHWGAESRWRPRPLTLLVLVAGLSLFGFAEGLLFITHLGNSPWVVLAEGVSERSGLGVGLVTGIISVSVLALWIPLRERPGLGTVLNIVIIATVLGLTVDHVPPVTNQALGVLVDIAAVLLIGLASALYLTTRMGPGPRDGLMTSIHNRTGVRVSRVRLAIEATVLTAGWLLGGTVGLGTVLFAAGIGRAIALWLGVLARLAHPRPAAGV